MLSADFCADGHNILTASGDTTAKLWSMMSGECMRTFRGHIRSVNLAISFHYSPSVFTASLDGTAKMWSADTGECLRTFGQAYRLPKPYPYLGCEALALSRDGASLLTCCRGSIQLWSVTTGRCTGVFERNTFTMHSVALPPDGSSVLTCGCDWDACLWHVQTGKCVQLASPSGHTCRRKQF